MTVAKKAKPNDRPVSKSTGKSTGVPVGALIPQPHGGALRNGGTNAGGTGRPLDVVRAALAKSFDDRRSVLEVIADDMGLAPKDRIKAMDVMGKYGLGTKDEVSLVDHPEWKKRMEALRAALLEIVGEEKATQVIVRADELVRAR